jgi:hypothetical protein
MPKNMSTSAAMFAADETCANTADVPTRPIPSDDYANAIAWHLHLHSAEIFPHLPDLKFPAPGPVPPQQASSWRDNPFARPPGRARPSQLGPEVTKLFSAISFAMRHHGVVMNTHVTISWRSLGVSHHREATRQLTKFNHRAAKWLMVGAYAEHRRRMTQRTWMGASPHMYVYVHENARDEGFHTHLLCYVPVAKAELFEAWARGCLARLCRRSRLDGRAVYITTYRSRNEADGVARCWDWFRYITKSLSPNRYVRADDGSWELKREVFNPYAFRETDPVHSVQLASGSHNIWMKAQRQAGFVSCYYEVGGWNRLYSGWEIEAYHQDRRDEARAAEMEQMLSSMNLG